MTHTHPNMYDTTSEAQLIYERGTGNYELGWDSSQTKALMDNIYISKKHKYELGSGWKRLYVHFYRKQEHGT